MRVTTCPRTDAHAFPALAPRARVMTRHTDAHGEWEGMRVAIGAAAFVAIACASVVVCVVACVVYVLACAVIGN